MRDLPVAGWRTGAADFELPADAVFVTSDVPAQSEPFIGYLGDRSYFLASRPGTGDWWLVGVDVGSGRALFPAVPLASASPYRPYCYLNGPAAVLCLRGEDRSYVAWVIDAESGAVTFSGPTPLAPPPGRTSVEAVGTYAVAGEQNRGVSGVGARAEPTWFVPGDGGVDQRYRLQSDLGAPALATQTTGGSATARKVVFALSDGKVMTPDVGAGRQALNAAVYPGGYAVEVGPTGELVNPDEVLFFDEQGTRLGRVQTAGTLAADSPDVPIIVTSDGATVYTRTGAPLLRISDDAAEPDVRLVGSRLLVNLGGGSAFPQWTQYDLSTGAQGPTCEVDFGNYLGTDGSVVVLHVQDPRRGRIAKAVDLTDCEVLWTLSAQPESQARVWRVNSTLVQLSDDATELMSLAAPGQTAPGPVG